MCSEPSNVAIGSFLNYLSVTWLFFQPVTSSSGNGHSTTWAIVTSQQGGTDWKCYLKQDLFIAALWSPAGKGLTTWLSFVMLNSVLFVNFLCGILGQVWYLIVSIPDLCPFIT